MKRELVLVIEDNQDMRTFLSDAVLKPGGYRFKMITNGKEGLEYALETEPDLILLDLNLPHLSGLDILSKLKERGLQVNALVVSAYGSPETILQAFHLGAKDFLQKPFTVDQAQAAIENALREERLRREKENLTHALSLANHRLKTQIQNWIALHNIAQAITSTLDETKVFQRVMQNVNRILRVEAGTLMLLNQKTEKLEFTITMYGDEVRSSDFQINPDHGIAGWVARKGKPLLVPDVEKDDRFYGAIDQITGFKSQSILCVPLKTQGQVIGVIEVINKQDGPESPSFTHGDMELLTMLASWVAVAVENARLNRAMRDMAATKTLGQTVATIAHHINNRLMAFSLELDKLEEDSKSGETALQETINSARLCIQDVSAVIKALDRLERIQTVPYVGSTEMIDIGTD